MQTNDTTQGKGRKPYKKPKIERVHLVAEEAVLATCKTDLIGAAIGSGAGCIGFTGECVTTTS